MVFLYIKIIFALSKFQVRIESAFKVNKHKLCELLRNNVHRAFRALTIMATGHSL